MSLFSALRSNDYTDPILAEIKEKLRNIELWVPSHCKIYGNDREEKLVDMGMKLSQREFSVTGKITRARIKRKEWRVEHDRAPRTYKNRMQLKKRLNKMAKGIEIPVPKTS